MVTNVVVVWALAVMPPLCMAGVVTHPCACTEGACCPSECGCDGNSQCGHESHCGDDPCGRPFVYGGRSIGRVIVDSVARLASWAIPQFVPPPLLALSTPALQVAPDVGKPFPRPASDVPLLV